MAKRKPTEQPSVPSTKKARLQSIGQKYHVEPRLPDDIDSYEAANEWNITPKAAEIRLNKEVAAKTMISLLVRSDNNRVLRVWRDVHAD